MRILQRSLPAILFALPLVLPGSTKAAEIAAPIVERGLAGSSLLVQYINTHIIMQALLAFWGVSFFALFYYSARLVVESYKDESHSDMSKAVIFSLIGFGVISCAAAYSTAFTTFGLSGTTTSQIQPLVLKSTIDSIRQFIITLSTGIFVLMIVITALRMISAKGEQGDFDKWRKVLISCCMGVMIMFIADFIIQAVDGRDALLIVEELRGIALFVLTFAGFLCVLALIIAGIMLIISIDESLRDRAKKTVIGTLIALAIVICAYAIILTFVPGGTSTTLI